MAKMINLSIKLKQKVASCGSRMQKIGDLWLERLKIPHFTKKKKKKKVGSLGDSRDNQQKYGVIG